jgi:protein associated with RNAse G/E
MAGLEGAVPGQDVWLVFTKYDRSLHWHQKMQYLGEDEHGVWLGSRAGATAQRGDEPPIRFDAASVQLVPAGQWWTAVFNDPPAKVEVYCDISTPPQWRGPDEITMVDLDLDVVRLRAERRVFVDDEDEFAEHQVRFGYTPDVVSRAEQAAAWLLAAVGAGVEPFGSAAEKWLDKVR